MNKTTRTITVVNEGGINYDVTTTIGLTSGASISSFSPDKGYLSGKKWIIPKMYDGETQKARIDIIYPNGHNDKVTVTTFGKTEEIDLSDNTDDKKIQTPNQVSCAPPNAECGQPTVSLLEGFNFGVIQSNMAIDSCLSTHCLHRFSVQNLSNVKNLDFNKANGDFSLQPRNPFLPWSFDFKVKSYDCTVDVKGKTQFEPDGPKTISGGALYTPEDFMATIGGSLDTYSDRIAADADPNLQTGEWFLVENENYPNQATLNIKI